MAQITDVISQASSVIGLAVLIGAAGVVLWSSVRKGKSDVVRQDNQDLRASNTDKDKTIDNNNATIQAQEGMIKTLKEVATQTPAVTKLIDIIASQNAQSANQHTEVIKQLSSVAKELGNVAKAIKKDGGQE